MGRDDAPTLLLIAGFGVQAIGWPDVVCRRFIDAGFRVIRYDHRDVGYSTKLDDAPTVDLAAALQGDFSSAPYQLDDMAADAVALLDALHVDQAHVVGESMGGMIAQLVAIQHPVRVASLSLLFTNTGAPGVGQPNEAGRQRLMGRTQATDHSRDAIVERWMEARRLTASPGFPLDEDTVRTEIAASVDRAYHPAGRLRQLVAMGAQWDRTEQLGSIKVPTLVIHGTDDPMVDVSGGYALADAIPDAELMVIEGLAHEWPVSLRNRLADAILRNVERA
jgi:pimeloyl-ACP methyl ester carboxylesterase